jgi:hypothetical protein
VRGYLGNTTRSRGKGGTRAKSGNTATKKKGRRRKPSSEVYPDLEEFEVISSEELSKSKEAMNLTVLKKQPASELVDLAQSMGLENLARSRKQDIIFSILKAHAKNGEDIYGDGTLEILQDGSPIWHGCHPFPGCGWCCRDSLSQVAVQELGQLLLRDRAQQGPVREPDAAVPDRAAQA